MAGDWNHLEESSLTHLEIDPGCWQGHQLSPFNQNTYTQSFQLATQASLRCNGWKEV